MKTSPPPSVAEVGFVHVHFPAPCDEIDPSDAVMVTASPSRSENVPPIDAVWSCSTEVLLESTFTSGRSFPVGDVMTSSPSMPLVAWKKMWQWKTQRPRAPPAVVPSGIGRGSSLILNVSVYPGGMSMLSLNSG